MPSASSRGNTLNIELKLPNKRIIDISLPESSKVADVFKIAEEASGIKFPASECSLFWKGSRLGNKMTLDYYRIPNRGKVELTRKLHSLTSDSVSNTATPRKGSKRNPIPDDLVIPNSPNQLLKQRQGYADVDPYYDPTGALARGPYGGVGSAAPHPYDFRDDRQDAGSEPYQGNYPAFGGFPPAPQIRFVDDRAKADDDVLYTAPAYHTVANQERPLYPSSMPTSGHGQGPSYVRGGTSNLMDRMPGPVYQPNTAPPAAPYYDPLPSNYYGPTAGGYAGTAQYRSPTRSADYRPPSAVAYNPLNSSLTRGMPLQQPLPTYHHDNLEVYNPTTNYYSAGAGQPSAYGPSTGRDHYNSVPLTYIGGKSSGAFSAPPPPPPRAYESSLAAAAYPAPPRDTIRRDIFANYNRSPSTSSVLRSSANDPRPPISGDTVTSRILQEQSRQAVRDLERNVQANNSQYEAAVDRISQLENTVLRLQTIAERAVTSSDRFTPSASFQHRSIPVGSVDPLGVPSRYASMHSGAPLRY